jgi:ubiquinone/menaquinone biosynthesis C-methylase UbiE
MSDHHEAERRTAGLFDSLARDYDASGVDFFQPIARRLVTALEPVRGESWLDLGCGRGAVLLPLAEAVDPGRVVGVDVSPAMVVLAAEAASSLGLANVEVMTGSAQVPDPTLGPFDGIASSLVLFFLPEPLEALRAWLPLLRPGGQVGVTTFGRTDERWEHVDTLLAPYLPKRDARTSGGEGPFGTDAGMEELLLNAGFVKPRTVSEPLEVTFKDADQWHAFSMSVGQRAAWMAIPEEDRESVREETRGRLHSYARPDGSISFTQVVRHTLAQRGDV